MYLYKGPVNNTRKIAAMSKKIEGMNFMPLYFSFKTHEVLTEGMFDPSDEDVVPLHTSLIRPCTASEVKDAVIIALSQ